MFTDLLIDSWNRKNDDFLDCESSNDYNQYIGEVISQLDHSSPDMFQIISVPAIHKNVTEYFENNVSQPMLKLRGISIKSYEIFCYYYLKQSQSKSWI